MYSGVNSFEAAVSRLVRISQHPVSPVSLL